MMDRETVITHLQIIHTWAEFARERDLQFFTQKHLMDIAQWADDAIALLKEDCHNCKLECLLQKYDELKEKYDALLKKQEAFVPLTIDDAVGEIMNNHYKRLREQKTVKPKTGHWIYKKYDDMFMCSSCEKYSIRNDYPYCHWCGAKMKQEGR